MAGAVVQFKNYLQNTLNINETFASTLVQGEGLDKVSKFSNHMLEIVIAEFLILEKKEKKVRKLRI